MVGIKTLSLLAIAGSAIAAPQRGHFHGGNGGSNIVTINDVVYTTVMVTVTAGQEPTPTPAAPVVPETPSAAAAAAATTTPAAAAAAFTPEASPSTPAPSASSNSGSSTGGYMGIVSEWRSKMSLSALNQDGTLEGNALKTCEDSGGELNHELNPGSMAQVLAPGDCSDFEKVFVGGWLCEMPSLPGLDGICSSMSQGWSYDGQTGHAEILSNPKYDKIGCACNSGIWACDLA